MYIIGVFLILLSIIFDEGTTWLLMLAGFGSLESNPIFTRFGIVPYFLISLVFYLVLIWSWGKIIKLYGRFYKQKAIGYKTYDIFIFFFCFMIVFSAGSKIELGYGNIGILIDTFNEEKNDELKEVVEYVENLKEKNPVLYQEKQDDYYKQGTLTGVNYFQIIFYLILSYLLFRVGNKVVPYEFA